MSFGLLDAGNVGQYSAQIDQLIRQAIQAESQPVQQLEEQKSSLLAQEEIFDQASSNFAGLQSKADALGGTFERRSVESSNPSIVDVTAGPGAHPGSYEIAVQQLAKAHTLASHQIPSGGLNLLEFFGPGERSFSIIAQGQRVQVSFEIPEIVEETGQPPTNEDVLRIISDAIRQANADAGLGRDGFSAQTIRDTTRSSRLIIKSNQTGSANQLYFEDPQGTLRVLGVNPNIKADELNGGWVNGAEGQDKVRDEVVKFFTPIADLDPANVPAIAQELGRLANYAAQLTDGEGLPLAQSLSNVIQLLTENSDITDDLQLELAFDSIADLVDRVDDQAVQALANEFLRRAGDLRGPGQEGVLAISALPYSPIPGTDSDLATAFETLAQGIRLLGQGTDTQTAFTNFKAAFSSLTTQDRAELLQQFNEALNGLNTLRRKEGDELTGAFSEMIPSLFDLTLDERTSVAVQLYNIADIASSIGTDGATRVADEFRNLGDLVESLSQPLSEPLETPYADGYTVLYVLPPETKATLATELSSVADQLDGVDKSQIGDVFRNLASAVSDPDIGVNFTRHFNDFATALGSLNIEDRNLVRQELASFTEQIRHFIPPDHTHLVYPNFQSLVRAIDGLNAFQAGALQDQVIALTEALDFLVTDDRSVIRDEMANALQHLRTVFPIEIPEGMEGSFTALNGASNDLSQEDRNILSAELARYADPSKLGRAFDALARTVFYAGEPGSLDAHKQEFFWHLGALDEYERAQFVDQFGEVADRLPGLIGEDAVPLVPVLREAAQLMAQPIVFEAPAAQFLSAFSSASSATGTFNDTEIEEINRYLPELAEVLANNVNDRQRDLAQNLYNAGYSLAQLSPGAQETLQAALEQIAVNLGASLTGAEAETIPQQLTNLLEAIENIDNYESLDAKFTLDGIPIIRSSNTVSDLLDGVTLQLNSLTDPNSLDPSGGVVRVNIDNDLGGMMEEIQAFIDAYNETVNFVEAQTNIDAETSERAALAGDRDYLRLRLALRRAINDPITLADSVAFLKDIGIGVGTGVHDTNEIRIEDSAALQQALSHDLGLVQALLAEASGRVSQLVDEYLRPSGVIDKDKSLLESSVERLDDRLGVLNTRLDSREGFLRMEYNNIAEQLLSLTGQTQALQGFGGLMGAF